MGLATDKKDQERSKREAARANKASTKPLFLRRQDAPTDLSEIDLTLLATAIVRCVTAGDAVMLGMTQDGGAMCLTIYQGGERMKEYLHGTEEIEYALRALIDSYE